MLWKGDQSPRVKKEREPTLRGKREGVFSGRDMDNVPKETHVVSFMTPSPVETRAKGQRRKGRSSSPASHSKQNPHKQETSLDKSEIEIRRVNSGILSSVWITDLKNVYMATNAISDMLRQKERPAKSQIIVVVQRISCDIEGVFSIGVVYLKILIRESLFHVTQENWDLSTPSNSPRAPGTKSKFGKERVHREGSSKSVRLMSAVLARQHSGKDHIRRPCSKKSGLNER